MNKEDGKGLDRREFLKWGLGGLGALGLWWSGCAPQRKNPEDIAGEIKGANFKVGHFCGKRSRLRCQNPGKPM